MKLKLALILAALVGSAASFAPAPAQGPGPLPDPPRTPPTVSFDSPPPPTVSTGSSTPPSASIDLSMPSTASTGSPREPFLSRPNYILFPYNASPEEANVAQAADQLTRQYWETKSDTEREKIKTQLVDWLKQQFNLRQKRHQREIEELEAQVKKLKNLVEKRQENRNEIIARRLEQIQRESQGLGW